jgi:long-subunit fatty acid transport protein
MLAGPMGPRPSSGFVTLPARAGGALVSLVVVLALAPSAAGQTAPQVDRDRIDITGRQNLTLGSGARAYGMGGAFLARADDATAASWNPAGLSYLRAPELSLVGVSNSVDTARGNDYDRFKGTAVDFAALTWPVSLGEASGAVQVSYQRAISFDGDRTIHTESIQDDGRSNGGFDVLAFGMGLRLSRVVRAGATINRWFNGYDQKLLRQVPSNARRPLREFDLDFRPRGWNFNLGLIVSPIEQLNLAVVYKTPFTAAVTLDKSRHDYYAQDGAVQEVTENAFASDSVRLEFPSSFGFGVSWRPLDPLTFSADFTQTAWSQARIRNYFDLNATPASEGGTPATPPAPNVYPDLQYPTLQAVPESDDPNDPLRLAGQQNAQQIRVGVEYVVIKGRLKVPLRAGYFNDRQITPNPGGEVPRFNGVTAGTGIILGSVLFDFAYVYEFGEYLVTQEAAAGGNFDVPTVVEPPIRNTLKTQRIFASISYRFSGRP